MADLIPPATTASSTPAIPARLADESSYDVDPGRPWLLFAGVMFVLIGALNVVHGIAAVSSSAFFTTDANLVLGDLETWGWALIAIGAVQLAVAVGIALQSEAARWVGVLLVGANIILQFIVMPAHTGWALAMLFVDMIVLLALMNFGGRDRWAMR